MSDFESGGSDCSGGGFRYSGSSTPDSDTGFGGNDTSGSVRMVGINHFFFLCMWGAKKHRRVEDSGRPSANCASSRAHPS